MPLTALVGTCQVNWNRDNVPPVSMIGRVSKYLYPPGPVTSMYSVVVVVEPGLSTSTSKVTVLPRAVVEGPETRSEILGGGVPVTVTVTVPLVDPS